MPLIRWTGAYSVGVPELDEQHQCLMELMNNFHQAMVEGQGRDKLEGVFAALTEYAAGHFRSEEEWMEGQGYPRLAEHRRQHEDLFRRLQELQGKSAAANPALSVSTAMFLSDWLREHILRSDRMYDPRSWKQRAA